MVLTIDQLNDTEIEQKERELADRLTQQDRQALRVAGQLLEERDSTSTKTKQKRNRKSKKKTIPDHVSLID